MRSPKLMPCSVQQRRAIVYFRRPDAECESPAALARCREAQHTLQQIDETILRGELGGRQAGLLKTARDALDQLLSDLL